MHRWYRAKKLFRGITPSRKAKTTGGVAIQIQRIYRGGKDNNN